MMKTLNVKLDDWTHKNLKALAALRETNIADLLKKLVDKEISENPEECELCRKYGRKPNEETTKALKESRKLNLSKSISGKAALAKFDKEFGGK